MIEVKEEKDRKGKNDLEEGNNSTHLNWHNGVVRGRHDKSVND